MNIPLESAWMIVLAIVGFVMGTLWGHHTAIQKRVTYEDCEKARKECPCTTDMQKLQKNFDGLHDEVTEYKTELDRVQKIVQ